MCLYVLNVSFLDLDQMAWSCLIANISKLRKITSITLGGGVQSHFPKALGLLCIRATVRASRETLILFILLLWKSLPVPLRVSLCCFLLLCLVFNIAALEMATETPSYCLQGLVKQEVTLQ